MVLAAVSRVPTSTAPSWLRNSPAPNQKIRSRRSGPPAAPEYCCRSKGGVSASASSVAGRACHAPSRAKIDAVPRIRLAPERVTMLIADAAERPRSAPKRLVAIWNSWTASIGRFSSGPPTTSSLLSWPSTMMLPPRPNWPPDETSTLLLLVGSKVGVGWLPGTRNASSRKLRPFSGSVSICAADSTPSIAVVTGRPTSLTVTASSTPPIVSATSRCRS